MSPDCNATAAPAHLVSVFDAEDLYVTTGVNLGDGVGHPQELCEGDIYALDELAVPSRLRLSRLIDSTTLVIAEGSELGITGETVTLSAALVLMAPDGQKVDLLLLEHRASSARWLLPLTPIAPRTDYTLLQAGDPPGDLRLSDIICLSFHRGTRITLASGAQLPIEEMTPGTRVLTRDHGPQPVRWIGRTTLRARGGFAPVVITRGTMGNDGDLIVGPHHRLFFYQRDKLPSMPVAELLVQAQHLVDGETVFRREGGYAEYFSMVFDRHEIIYAEGIPVESLMVNEATVAALPPELAEALRSHLPGLSQNQHFGVEPDATQVADLLPRTRRRRRKLPDSP